MSRTAHRVLILLATVFGVAAATAAPASAGLVLNNHCLPSVPTADTRNPR